MENFERKSVIESNEKWFKFFVKLPMILTIVSALFYFVWGIVDPAIFQVSKADIYSGNYYLAPKNDYYYGIMGLETYFGAMLVWWIIGAVVSVITYACTKLAVSYKILHIYYLHDIKESNEKLLEKQEDKE